jgi:phospholipid/cholesterol/gamma-HCH transport system substrate-binding protein
LDQKDNLAGVLLNDPSSAASFKAILKNLEAGSHKLDQDLEALQHNFLLKGFFKKKEKETPAQQ